ncbi:class I SAM-dependent methyltransferase [Allocatelliglobosispora scoriae]|nr:class I SAM-dependent methyltransferase [Allocatelliglobosispora scoriae]
MSASARWDEVLSCLTEAIGPGPRRVVIDGYQHADWFADRLSAALPPGGHEIAVADGTGPPEGGIVVWLRTPPPQHAPHGHHRRDAAIVVDLHDTGWPVIRHIDPALAHHDSWYLAETRAFFAARAAVWDIRFGDDHPAYARAVADLGVPAGGVVVDVGCGTGRALPALRGAAGPTGTVIGLDVTAEMLATARGQGRDRDAHLVLGDARRLPLRAGSVDAVFAAGLITHLPDAAAGLAELARVTAGGGRLALFHPSGRAALAARHGRALEPDEPLAEHRLRDALERTGWSLETYDDPPERFFALATRRSSRPAD